MSSEKIKRKKSLCCNQKLASKSRKGVFEGCYGEQIARSSSKIRSEQQRKTQKTSTVILKLVPVIQFGQAAAD